MAFVDINTKKIYGCKEGSYVWYHELGHIKFHEENIGATLDFWKGNILLWSIASIIIGVYFKSEFLQLLSLSLFCLYLLAYAYEEIWCWVYAIKNKK